MFDPDKYISERMGGTATADSAKTGGGFDPDEYLKSKGINFDPSAVVPNRSEIMNPRQRGNAPAEPQNRQQTVEQRAADVLAQERAKAPSADAIGAYEPPSLIQDRRNPVERAIGRAGAAFRDYGDRLFKGQEAHRQWTEQTFQNLPEVGELVTTVGQDYEKTVDAGGKPNSYQHGAWSTRMDMDYSNVGTDRNALKALQAKDAQYERFAPEQADGFWGKAVQGLASSAPAMLQSIALSPTVVGPSAYWQQQGAGSFMRAYIQGNDIDSLSDEDLSRAYKISQAMGVPYAAIELAVQSIPGMKGFGSEIDRQISNWIVKKAMSATPEIAQKLASNGIAFVLRWLLETGEEGGQGGVQELTRQILERSGIDVKKILSVGVDQTIGAAGTTLLMTATSAGGKALVDKAVSLGTRPQTVEERAAQILAEEQAPTVSTDPGRNAEGQLLNPDGTIAQNQGGGNYILTPENTRPSGPDGFNLPPDTPAPSTQPATSPAQGEQAVPPAPEQPASAPVASENPIQAARRKNKETQQAVQEIAEELGMDVEVKGPTNPGIGILEISEDGKEVRVSNDVFETAEKNYPGQGREVVKRALKEEQIHQRQINERGGRESAMQSFEQEWNDASPEVKEAVKEAYGNTDGLSDAALGAELARMREQVETEGEITESISPKRGNKAAALVDLLKGESQQNNNLTPPPEQAIDRQEETSAPTGVEAKPEGYAALPQKTRDRFEAAFEAKDTKELSNNSMLHSGNKRLRAEFESRTGIKLPKTAKGTDEAVRKWAKGEKSYEAPKDKAGWTKRTVIGKNRDGNEVFVDENGTRSYKTPEGIRATQPVALIHGRGGVGMDRENVAELYRKMRYEYLTEDEVSKAEMDEFKADIEMSGVAYIGDTQVKVLQENDGTFSVYTTKDGERKGASKGHKTIGDAQKAAIKISEMDKAIASQKAAAEKATAEKPAINKVGDVTNVGRVENAELKETFVDSAGIQFEYWEGADQAAYRQVDTDVPGESISVSYGDKDVIHKRFDDAVAKVKQADGAMSIDEMKDLRNQLQAKFDSQQVGDDRLQSRILELDKAIREHEGTGTVSVKDQLVPEGWENRGPDSMLAHGDPKTGGIIDKPIGGGEWFVIPNNDAIKQMDGFKTRDEAVKAFNKALREQERTERREQERTAEDAELKELFGQLRGMRNRLSMGVDPEIAVVGTKIASVYMKKGVRNFRDFAAGVKDNMGEDWDAFKKYLHSFWSGAMASNSDSDFFNDLEDVSFKQAQALIDNIDEEANKQGEAQNGQQTQRSNGVAPEEEAILIEMETNPNRKAELIVELFAKRKNAQAEDIKDNLYALNRKKYAFEDDTKLARQQIEERKDKLAVLEPDMDINDEERRQEKYEKSKAHLEKLLASAEKRIVTNTEAVTKLQKSIDELTEEQAKAADVLQKMNEKFFAGPDGALRIPNDFIGQENVEDYLAGRMIDIKAKDAETPDGAKADVEPVQSFSEEEGLRMIDDLEGRSSFDAQNEEGSRPAIDEFKPDPEKHSKPEIKLYEESLKLIKKHGGSRKVMEGRQPWGTLGVSYRKSGNIALNALNNISTAAHEVTHNLDRRVNFSDKIMRTVGVTADGKPKYAPSTRIERKELTRVYVDFYGGKKTHPLKKRVVEGFATFVQKYIEDPNMMREQYPKLTAMIVDEGGKYFDPSVKALISDGRKIVNAYHQQDPLQKIGSRISSETRKAGRPFLNMKDKIETQLFDRIWPVEKAAREAGVQLTDKDPSLVVREYERTGRVFAHNVKKSVGGKEAYMALRGGEYKKIHDFNWGTLEKTLRNDGMGDTFNQYLVARETVSRYEEVDDLERIRDEKRATLQAAREALEKLGAEGSAGFQFNGKSMKELVKEYKTANRKFIEQRNVLKKDNIDRKLAESAVEQAKRDMPDIGLYEEMFDRLVRADLDSLHEVGLISDNDYSVLKDRKGYVTKKRQIFNDLIDPETGLISSASNLSGKGVSSMKRRKGSELAIIDPIYASIANHNEILRKVMRQHVYNKLTALADKVPDLMQKEKLKRIYDPETGKTIYPQENDPNVIMGRDSEGKRVPFVVNKDLKKYLDAVLTPESVDITEQILAAGSRLFTKGTTSLYPGFMAMNIVVDQITATAQTRTNYAPVVTQLKLLGKALADDGSKEVAYIQEYITLAGVTQTLTGWNQMIPQKASDVISREASGLRRAAQIYQAGENILGAPTQASEILTRASEYVNARMKGDSQFVALEKAGRVTAPFHHRGSWGGKSAGRALVRGIPYLNASLQVTKEYGKSFFDERKGRVATVTALVIGAKVAELIPLMLMASDDQKEKYKDMEPDELARYIILPSRNGEDLLRFRIPEQMAGLGVGINMGLQEHLKKDGKAFNDYSFMEYKSGMTAWIPDQFDVTEPTRMMVSWIPQLGKPALESVMNVKTWPDIRPLESQSQQYRPVEERAYRTTSDAAKWASKHIGKYTGLSPIKIDHLLEGYLGRTAKLFTKFDREKDKLLAPYVRESYFEAGRRVQAFYDKAEKVDMKTASIRDKDGEVPDDLKNEARIINDVKRGLKEYRDLKSENGPEASIIRAKIIDGMDSLGSDEYYEENFPKPKPEPTLRRRERPASQRKSSPQRSGNSGLY